MAVLLETSKGDLVIDLFTEQCPKATLNFIKLCKVKYYNNVLFHAISKDFVAGGILGNFTRMNTSTRPMLIRPPESATPRCHRRD